MTKRALKCTDSQDSHFQLLAHRKLNATKTFLDIAVLAGWFYVEHSVQGKHTFLIHVNTWCNYQLASRCVLYVRTRR